MRCSRCSTVVKPVVALDIDGTLGDYHGHLLDFATLYLRGRPATNSERMSWDYEGGAEGSFREWFCEHFNTNRQVWDGIKLAYRQGGLKRSLPRFRRADAPSAAAHQSGAEVWVTTTRPYLRMDGIDPDTRFWLSLHGIEFEGLIYQSEKYSLLAERVDSDRVIMVLDDLPEQYDAAATAFGESVPLLRRTRYNAAVDRPNATDESFALLAAANTIRERAEAWYDARS